MRRLALCIFALSAAASLLLSPVARATIFGSVRGIVHDAQHRPLAEAQVKLQSKTSDWSRAAQTGQDGSFEFDAVPIGEYTIAVKLSGFMDASWQLTVESSSAPVLHLKMKIAEMSQSVHVSAEVQEQAIDSGSSTSEVLVNRAEIAQTPGADRTNSLAMITDFVPGAYMVHDQLHIRGGHQVTWMVDGVPVPNTSIASNVGPQFDPKDVDYLEVQRGGYAADYGDRTYGVFNVVPRTGFERNNEAEIVTSFGSFDQTNDEISFGGHTQRFAYYASVNANRSGYGLEAPVSQVLHDSDYGVGGFASFIFNATPTDQLRLVTSVRHDSYQVPNDPDLQAAGNRDNDHESDAFVNLSWVRTLNPGAVLTMSPFYHHNSAFYDGGPNDFRLVPQDDRASNYLGLQSSLAVVKGKNDLRAGFYVYGQHDNSLFGLRATDGSGLALTQSSALWGNLQSAFLEDQYKLTSWLTLNGGVRLTHYDGTVNENSADPRAGIAIRVPKLNWVFRGFYGRYYQAPPLDTISGPLLDLALEKGFKFLPLHGERDEEWEVGLAIPFHGWVLDEDYFHNGARNFLDHDVLLNSNIFFPLTIARARIRGWETTLRSPEIAHRAHVHLSYSHQFAEGSGGVTGGLTDFSPPAAGLFFLDHDQRDTLGAGYNIALPWRLFTTGDLNVGSGFLNGDGPEHLPAHATFDLSVGKNVGDRLSLSFTALNIANTRYLLDTSNTFGGTHFNDPQQFIAQIRWRFHY
jgi:outer membrane receptor protein involved in Fe transport